MQLFAMTFITNAQLHSLKRRLLSYSSVLGATVQDCKTRETKSQEPRDSRKPYQL
jgi:hypothetical protein